MKDVYELNRGQFIEQLEANTTPENIYEYANEIYAYLSGLFKQSCSDSLLREWSFQWASEKLGIDYEKIYDKWLG